jgi:hypothetical protein
MVLLLLLRGILLLFLGRKLLLSLCVSGSGFYALLFLAVCLLAMQRAVGKWRGKERSVREMFSYVDACTDEGSFAN